MKFKITIFTAVVLGMVALFLVANPLNKSSETSNVIKGRIQDHHTDVAILDKQWAVIHEATRLRKNGKIEEAIALYRNAADMGDPSVPHLILLEIYEKIGRYDQALAIINWLLKNDQNEQGRAETLETKARLLKKIQESRATQKKREALLVVPR